MRKSSNWLATAFLSLFLSPAITATAEQDTPVSKVSSIAMELDARIPALMEAAEVPGLSLAVVENGEVIWSRIYGMASVELERPMATNTILEAASLGKVVFALITLRLADQGIIDLDESIAKDFTYPLLDHDARFAELTPRLILQHASGLPNWGGYALNKERDPVQFKGSPGEGYGYSGEAYTALQSFVENRTGRGLEELFVDLAKEAGMTHSSFLSFKSHTDLYAQALRRDGTERTVFAFDWPGSAYSLLSTAEDLVRFMAFYFSGGGLSNSAFKESLRSFNPVAEDAWGANIPTGADISWTLAWGAQEIDRRRTYFHGGNNGEFRSFFAFSGDRQTGVALMTNGAGGLSFMSEIFNPFIGNITPAAVWWAYEAPPEGDASEN